MLRRQLELQAHCAAASKVHRHGSHGPTGGRRDTHITVDKHVVLNGEFSIAPVMNQGGLSGQTILGIGKVYAQLMTAHLQILEPGIAPLVWQFGPKSDLVSICARV